VTDGECRRLELGAYLVGSLEPDERALVDRHVADCGECLAELAELAPIPALLGSLNPAEARQRLLVPSPALLSRALEAVNEDDGLQRRRLRGWKLLASAAAAVAIAAALPQVIPTAAATPLAVMTGVTAAGMGTMEPRTWGTAVQLQLTGLPPALGYRAYATARDGHSEVAANWGATPGGRVTISGATAIPRSQLAFIQVRTIDGRPLMTLPC
jgi:anti-sigma factor RsiW